MKCTSCGSDRVWVLRTARPYPNWEIKAMYCVECDTKWMEVKRV